MLRRIAEVLRRADFVARRGENTIIAVSRPLNILRRFWAMQILGWSVYAGGIFIGLVPRRRYPDAVAYDLVFLVSVFAASFALRAACRGLFRRGIGLPKAMFQAVLVSIAWALPCGVVAELASHIARHIAQGETFDWILVARAWGGIIYSAVILTSWSGLYLGIKHYQFFEAEQERARQTEALARSAKLQALQLQLHPHFLFNTLNAISTLIVEGQSAAANHMLGQLAAFLRLTL